MKKIIEELKKIKTYRSADTVNHENFPAWKMSDESRLEQLAMTGTCGNSFYASAGEVTADALELLERADAEALFRAVIRGRNEGFIRTFPLLGLVVLSEKSPELFQKAFPRVVLTGNDLEDFIDMTRSMRGMGRAVKRAIHTYLRESVTPYYAMKYRKQLADAIRVSRFAGDDPLYAYILSTYSKVKGLSDDKVAEVYEKYPECAARKEFLALLDAGKTAEAAELLQKNRLDVESLSAYYHKFDAKLWKAAASVTPVMRFLKYMAKFIREGADIDEIAAKKLSVENLKAAKVFPFRLYPAYKALESIPQKVQNNALEMELEHVGFTVPLPQNLSAAELLKILLDDYTDSYDWSSFNQYSWVVAPDISGSMTFSKGSGNLTFAEISGMFTGFFCRGLDNVQVVPWDTQVHRYDIGQNAPVVEHIEQISKISCGGTYMDAPVEYMIANNIKTDYALFITDTTEYGEGWLAAWKRYKALNPSAQAFLLRLDPYGTQPMPDDEAVEYGIHQIFGWNDSVIDYMKYVMEKDMSQFQK